MVVYVQVQMLIQAVKQVVMGLSYFHLFSALNVIHVHFK